MGYSSEFSNDIKAKNAAATQAAPKSSAPQQGTTSSNAGVVPVGKSDKPNEIIEKLVNSTEFRALSKQEKLAELKRHFSTASDAELNSILDNINSLISQSDTNPKVPDQLNLDVNAIIKRVKTLAKDAKIKLDKKDLENLKKLLEGFNNGSLDTKQLRNGQLQELLKPFAAILDKISPSPEELKGKNPVDKLNARLDKFIDLLIMPGFSKLEEGNKANFREKFTDKIGQIINPNWSNYGEGIKKLWISMIAFLIDDEKSGMSINDLLTKNPEEIKQHFTKIMGNILDKYLMQADINFEDLKGKNPHDKLVEIITKSAEAAGLKISQDDDSMAQMVDMLGKHIFKDQWTNSDDKNMDPFKDSLALKLLAVKEYNQNDPKKAISYTDFFTDVTAKYEHVMKQFEDDHKIDLTASQATHREVIINKKKEPISYTDILNYLEEKQKNGKLSDDEKKEYDKIQRLINNLKKSGRSEKYIKEILSKPIQDQSNTISYYIQSQYNNNHYKYLNDYFNLGLGENATPEEVTKRLTAQFQKGIIKKDQLHAMFKMAGDYSILKNLGQAFGLNMNNVRDILGDDFILAIYGIEAPAERAQAAAVLANSKDDMSCELGRNIFADEAKELKPEERKPAEEIMLNGDRGKDNAKKLPEILREHDWNEKEISDIGIEIGNNKNINKENRGQFIDSVIETAPDDDARLMHSDRFSNSIKDPDMLEYVGAASKYVEDPGKKTQYTSYVTEAAKSYPPETQARVQQAIETGRVSSSDKETMPKARVSQPQASQPKAEQPKVSVDIPRNYTIPQTDTSSTTIQKPQTSTTQNIDEINQRTTVALQQKKDKTLDRIEDLSTKIAAEQAVHEITDEQIEDFADTIKELEMTEDTSKINEEKIKNFLNSNSVSVIYSKLIERFGSAIISRLINAVVTFGNASKIDALASIIKSGSLMEELFAKCQSKRLLDKLQSSTVKRFIPYINDLSAVRSDIMYEFIMDLINRNASIDEIKKYLVYLPFGMQASICETYNNLKGVSLDDNFALKPNRNNEKTDKTKQEEPNEKTQKTPEAKPAIAANEVTTVRNDGATIKHKSTFTGISDKQDDEAYEVVDNETGKTRSQREEVLTPGSYEWNLKYNKQAPKTAFTMAALEDDEEESVGMFGSTKVGMGQKIKKKYTPQSFKYNA